MNNITEIKQKYRFYIEIIELLNGVVYKGQLIKIAMLMMCCTEEYATKQIDELLLFCVFTQHKKMLILSDNYSNTAQCMTISTFDMKTAQDSIYRAELLINKVIPETAISCYQEDTIYPNKVLKTTDLIDGNYCNYVQILAHNKAQSLYWYLDTVCLRFKSDDLCHDINSSPDDLMNSDKNNFYGLAAFPFIISNIYENSDGNLIINAFYLANKNTMQHDILEALDYVHETFYCYLDQENSINLSILCPDQEIADKFNFFSHRCAYDNYLVENMNFAKYLK